MAKSSRPGTLTPKRDVRTLASKGYTASPGRPVVSPKTAICMYVEGRGVRFRNGNHMWSRIKSESVNTES